MDDTGLTTLSAADTTRVVRDVLGWTIARGVIIRRPAVVNLAERVQADERSTTLIARLRNSYGPARCGSASRRATSPSSSTRWT